MEHIIYTLHDFMLHTESVIYIIMGLSLMGILGFWMFLTQMDEDE